MNIFFILFHNKLMKKKIILISISFFILSFTTVFLSFIFSQNVYIDKPNYIEIKDNEENTIDSFISNYKGNYVSIDNVSSDFILTLINTEDKNFYKHNGFDYKRIFKSLFDNLMSSSLSQGASTITQQLAKNLYLTSEKTWTRKIKEAFLSIKIEKKYTKDQILEFYINNVYFAHNLYGIYSASHYYFHKDPINLNFQESCLLVGVINAPNIYSPFIDIEASKTKQKNIAYNLFLNDVITAEEYFNITSTNTILYGYFEDNNYNNYYYYQGIMKELKSENLYDENNTEQGLIIDSYLDNNIQSIIEKNSKIDLNNEELAIIVMKPYSNQVLALLGGKNYLKSQFNRALESKRQIGSTIKPFIYYLGLCSGLSPLSKFKSEPTTFHFEDGSTYSPKNSNNIYAYKDITMIEALAMSDNIYAVKTSLVVGTDSIKSLLNKMNADIENQTLAISLGGIEITPLQLISFYNTLASEGTYYQPSFINKVSTSNGLTLYENNQKSSSILKYEECLMINHMLKSPFDSSLITYSTPTMNAYKTKNTFACKTGTTTSSSWTIGFNKEYTLLVYVGSDDNSSLSDYSLSKKIWQNIANELTINKKDEFYDYPSNLTKFKFHNSLYSTYSFEYIKRKD